MTRTLLLRTGRDAPSAPGATTTTDALPADRAGSAGAPGRDRLAPLRRACRGRPDDHPAARPALLVLLVGTATLYLWGLGASGWANSFYSAAAQAGSDSWSAMFFGASDAAGSITVDKTPMSIWVMALSVRLFGLSSWSILVPQALMGVATVALLHATVRRTTGNAWAGIVAGTVLALTPVAVLMFRFNNPDALLVLLLVGSVHATLRALESPERAVRWLVLGGALVGFGFLTKMLQAFLVLPALAGVYLLLASVPLVKRLVHLLAAFGAMVLAGGWWVLVVELWPADSRPYIGGSQENSVLELTLGYNGLGRLNGDEVGSVGGGNGWGETGLLRLFSSEIGGQVAWLLPAALVLLGAGLWLVRRPVGEPRGAASPRRRMLQAGLVAWGLWLVVTGLTFSLMAGIFHAYYTVALAPAIAALVGIGGWVLWRRRDSVVAVVAAAVALASTAALSAVLLGRADGFVPWLAPVVAVVGVGAAAVLAVLRLVPARWRHRAGIAVAVATAITALAGPAAYAIDTAATPHTGSIPSAGPDTGRDGGPGGRGGFPGGPQGQGANQGGPQGAPPGGQNPGQGAPPQGAQGGPGQAGRTQGGQAQGGQAQGGQAQGGPAQGNAGGLLQGSESSDEIDALLTQDADSYTWVAAAIGSNSAAGFQLSTQEPVMAVGGFNGSDPSPTLEEFQQLVADGEIHWFVAGGQGGRGGGAGPGASGSTSSRIQAWVEETFTARTVDGTTLYDLSGGVR